MHTRLFALTVILVCLTAPALSEDFVVVALPDTQNYSESYPELYDAQTQWIADNLAAQNIEFVTHLGDLVQHAATLWQWDNAKASMTTLDTAGVPYGTCVGNHDILYPGDYYDPAGLNYLANFGPQFYQGQVWYRGASPSGLSNYEIITADGREWLFLHILVETPPQELAWAQEVLNQHRDKPTMLSTHRYLFKWPVIGQGRYSDFQYTFEPPYRPDGIQANDLWNNFVARNKQIYMVICGHNAGEYRQVSTNSFGLPVHEILVDYQDGYGNGGNAYLRIMKFRADQDLIEVQSYSPSLDSYLTGDDSQFNLTVDFDSHVTTDPYQQTVRFQEGEGGYAGTQDTWINEDQPSTSYGSSSILVVDDDTTNVVFPPWAPDYLGEALIRFDNMFQAPVYEGYPAPTAIPLGATILSATLRLTLADDTDIVSPEFYIYRMTADWNEGTTWNSLGNGINVGTDTDPALVGLFYGDNDPDLDFTRSVNVISAVSAWSAGAPNYGFGIIPERQTGTDDGVEIYSSEAPPLASPPESGRPAGRAVSPRPALDVEYRYTVLNTPPTIDAALAVSETTVNEGRQVELTITATDPNPLDPLTFQINGIDVSFATGTGTLSHWVLMEDDDVYTFDGYVVDDEAAVYAGTVQVTVLNVDPNIVEITDDLTVGVDEMFTFSALAEDPGLLDVLTYRWDLDDDGQYDDFVGETGQWSFSTAGPHTVRLFVQDNDGGSAFGQFIVTVVAALPGDMNCDGSVDFGDINPFVLGLTDPAGYDAAYPDCDRLNGDLDGSGAFDFSDINPFVALLVGP